MFPYITSLCQGPVQQHSEVGLLSHCALSLYNQVSVIE